MTHHADRAPASHETPVAEIAGLQAGGAGHDHTSVGRPVLDSPSDYLLAAVLALVAVVTVGVWSTGQTAALITGHGWPPVPGTDGLGIAGQVQGDLVGDFGGADPADGGVQVAAGPVLDRVGGGQVGGRERDNLP